MYTKTLENSLIAQQSVLTVIQIYVCVCVYITLQNSLIAKFLSYS